MPGFRRASTPTFQITPVGYTPEQLGTPHMTLDQDMVHVELECTVSGNTVSGTLSYLDSLQFVAGNKTHLQVVWDNDGVVVAFPYHELDVFDTHYEFDYVTGATGDTGETGSTGDTSMTGEG